MIQLFYLSLFLFLGFCAFFSLIILVQGGKSLGFGSSFGGDSNDSLLGTSTPHILKRFTAYLACIFMGSCLALSLWSSSLGRVHVDLPESEEIGEIGGGDL